MSKAFRKIMGGLEDALAFTEGETTRGKLHAPIVNDVDVGKLRKRLGVSQSEFAAFFNLPIATIKNWEQGRRQPEGPAKALLMVIEHSPEVVFSAMHTTSRAIQGLFNDSDKRMFLVRRHEDDTWSTVEKNPRHVVIADTVKASARGRIVSKRARFNKSAKRLSANAESRK